MKILLTGAKGQLGMAIRDKAARYPMYDITYTDVEELDICSYPAVEKMMQAVQPDVIINCASYNAVDKAEDEPLQALQINGKAVQGLAGIAKKEGIGLVHISTDFVFDGKKNSPYLETDEPHPQSKYAHSKYIGEQAVNTAKPAGYIIRTSWLYSEYGQNFVKTILRLAAEKEELRVVNDQQGSPTYAGDLAGAILDMLPGINAAPGVRTYHYSNEGHTHWAGFASEVVKLSGLDCRIKEVSTEEYGLSKAARPAYSLLDKSKVKEDFGLRIPAWQESLKICIDKLIKKTI